jgi:hypothetical protein
MVVLKPSEMRKHLQNRNTAFERLRRSNEILEARIEEHIENELEKAAKGDSAYINPDKTFKGGFQGCVRYQMNKKGLAKENATKLCAFIGRKAGKIP